MTYDVASQNDGLDQACAFVGRFLYEFAKMERALDSAIAKLFEVSDAHANTITANIDFARKVNILHHACLIQTSNFETFKNDEIEKLFKSMLGINEPYRTRIAHQAFEPAELKGVTFDGRKARTGKLSIITTMTAEEFEQLFAKMIANTNQIVALTNQIRPKIAIDHVEQLDNNKLRKSVKDLTSKMRALEKDLKHIEIPDDREPGWQNRLLQVLEERNATWRHGLLPQAAAIIEELRRRVKSIDKSPPPNLLSAIDFGMLAGVAPLSEAALEMERLVRVLPNADES